MNKGSTDTADSPEDAVDSSDATEAEGNMMMATADNSDAQSLTGLTAAEVAATIALNIGMRFTPASCVSATATAANVAVTYTDCTGPRGLVHVTGDLGLAISIDATSGDISIAGTANDLQVNGATLDVNATGVYSGSGSTHSLAVTTMGSGTGPRGTAIEHDGSYTVSWDEATQCGSLDGSWSTTIGSGDRDSTANISRCAAGCPTGTLTHKYLADITLTLTFDGTATADWSLSTGATGTFALSCTAQ